ncbi:MAG: hypothetical protein ACREJD_03940 [Phycisphaerales bacterium]
MSEQFNSAISELRGHRLKQLQEVKETERLINKLSLRAGLAAPFPGADAEGDGAGDVGSIRRDQFYGVALATAIRKYLEMRRVGGVGPATVSDIYSALCLGGFKFEAKNEANAKRGLYISLAKNTAVFHKLPGGTDESAVFGLIEWYPSAKAELDRPIVKRRDKKRTPAEVRKLQADREAMKKAVAQKKEVETAELPKRSAAPRRTNPAVPAANEAAPSTDTKSKGQKEKPN